MSIQIKSFHQCQVKNVQTQVIEPQVRISLVSGEELKLVNGNQGIKTLAELKELFPSSKDLVERIVIKTDSYNRKYANIRQYEVSESITSW